MKNPLVNNNDTSEDINGVVKLPLFTQCLT